MGQYVMRDMQCSDDVGKMAELGKFDREFTTFGYAYSEKKEVLFRVGRNEEAINQLFKKAQLIGKTPTLVEAYCLRTGVPSGGEDTIWNEAEWGLADRLASA